MSGDIPLPQRRSVRLAHFDYAREGAYFVTICALNRESLFGDVIGDEMHLSEGGRIAHEEWLHSGEMRREVELDAFVVMPNHVHGVVLIVNVGGERYDGGRGVKDESAIGGNRATGVHRTPLRMGDGDDGGDGEGKATGVHRTPLRNEGGARWTPLRRPAGASLGALVNGYKAAVTRRMTAAHLVAGASVWQRNYYEHVIRNEEDLARIRRYIADNPAKWALDRENPTNHMPPPPHP